MFTATLVIKAPNWKLYKYLSTGKWENKLWCMHTLEHYAAMKPMQTTHSNSGQYVIVVSKRQKCSLFHLYKM